MEATLRMGVDVGGTKLEAVVLGPEGAVVARRRVPTPQGDYAATLRAIAALVGALEAESGARCSVGLGTPGAPSPLTGRMKNCNSTCLNGKPLQADLEALLGRPVRLANDADCMALSEATDGAGARARTVLGVILGTGVGAGVVVGGALLAGPNAIAGEWGHNGLPWPTDDERPGPPCYCGKRGCIETFLSGPAWSRDDGRGLTAEELVARMRAGEPDAGQSFGRYVERLARALASVINVLDPHVVVLAGGMSNVDEVYTRLPPLLGVHVFGGEALTPVVRAAHGDSSGVRGAAWLWGRQGA